MPGPWEDTLKIIFRWLLPRLLNVISFVFKYWERRVAQSCSPILHFQKIPWCESGHIATAANLYILIKCTKEILFLMYGPNKMCKTLSREYVMCEWFRLVTFGWAQLNWGNALWSTWHVWRQEEHQGPFLSFLWVPLLSLLPASPCLHPPQVAPGSCWASGRNSWWCSEPHPSGMQEPPSTFTTGLQNWDTWDLDHSNTEILGI